MEKVSITENLKIFDKYWQSKIVGEFNNQNVKLVKLKGEFEWHHHKSQDELLLVLNGVLTVKLQENEVRLGDGEFFIVHRGIDHKLMADEEAQLFVVEPKSTLNTEILQK